MSEDTSTDLSHISGWVLQSENRNHGKGWVGTIHDKTVDGFPFPWTRVNVTFNAQKVAPFHAYMLSIEKKLQEPTLSAFKVLERTDAGLL